MVDLESPVTEAVVQQETPRIRAELHLRFWFSRHTRSHRPLVRYWKHACLYSLDNVCRAVVTVVVVRLCADAALLIRNKQAH